MTQADEYAVIYLLPEPARSYQLDLRLQVENTFGLTGRPQSKTPPHITLKYPFEADDPAEIEQALEEFAASAPPAPWVIRGFNHFTGPDYYVIFMEVFPTPAVRAAHAALLERLRRFPGMQWDQFDGADLHYHATISYSGLTDTNIAAVWSFINSRLAPDFDLYFDNLALLKISDDVNIVYKTFRLSGGATG